MDYVICRNALHRFKNPQEALRQMYSILKKGGRIYLRDLRRNANWNVVVKRIGDERWKNQGLVKDYVVAMASMLTLEELEKILEDLKIKKFIISDGKYILNDSQNDFREYEEETEYVCVITKDEGGVK